MQIKGAKATKVRRGKEADEERKKLTGEKGIRVERQNDRAAGNVCWRRSTCSYVNKTRK